MILCYMAMQKLMNYKTGKTVSKTLSEIKFWSKDNNVASNKMKTKMF